MKFITYLTIICSFSQILNGSDLFALDLIKKSTETEAREEFESVFGDLQKFEYIFIIPENNLISVLDLSEDGKITRKYWRRGIPKEEIKIKILNENEAINIVNSINKIITKFSKETDDSLPERSFFLFKRNIKLVSWDYAIFKRLDDPEYKNFFDIMIPSEEIADPKDVDEFLEGISD